MSNTEWGSSTLLGQDLATGRLADGVVYGLFGIHLVLIIIAHATTTVLAWQLAASSVILSAALGCRLTAKTYGDVEQLQAAILSILGLTFVVLGVLYQSSSPGLGLGPSRPLAIIVVFLVIVTSLLIATDPRRYTGSEWAAVVCFVILVGIYFSHSLAYHPSSSQSRWPIWAAIVMGCHLLVIPRLISERVFLWFLPRLAAITVVLGLITYLTGDYTLWIFEIRQYPSSPDIPGFNPDITTIQSIFPNPNSLGLLSFAGLVAGVIELHQSIVDQRPLDGGIAAALAGICGLGVFLSNARASMLAAVVVIAIYTAYVVGGRLTVPPMVIASTLGVFGLLAGMYMNVIDISSSNRFELWSASLRAIRDGPLLFGYGSGPASIVIQPYLDSGASVLPHNAYLTVFLQAGLVGGFAYLGLVGGSIVAGTINYREVNIAMLAFVVGWAVHQGFESYTLFRWSIGPVLATLAIGYLLFSD